MCAPSASSRLLGTEAVLPLMLRTEAAEAERYQSDVEATDVMAQQDRAAGRTIAAMQGIPEGGRIARSEGRHRAEVGGVLRAVVFGVNDGLVSNFSLVMGVAGGTSNNSVVLLAGIAGLVAGAFSMASGEWISIRSQRELYENELRIEQEELRRPGGGARRARDDLPGQRDRPTTRARLVATLMDRNDVALDTLAREELGLDPQALGSPWVAAGSSFAAFALGAVLPVIPFLFGSGTSATIVAAVLSIVALFAVGGVHLDLHRPPRRPRRPAHGAHRRGRRRGDVRDRQPGGPGRLDVEEAVALVAHLDAGVPQGDVPVAPHRGVGLLHAVVGDEHERGVVERPRSLDGREHLTDTASESRTDASAISENGPPSWNAESVSVKLHQVNAGSGYDWSR